MTFQYQIIILKSSKRNHKVVFNLSGYQCIDNDYIIFLSLCGTVSWRCSHSVSDNCISVYMRVRAYCSILYSNSVRLITTLFLIQEDDSKQRLSIKSSQHFNIKDRNIFLLQSLWRTPAVALTQCWRGSLLMWNIWGTALWRGLVESRLQLRLSRQS